MIAALWIILAAWPFRGEVADTQVVARAQGPAGPIEITAGRLRRFAEAHPDQSPRALAQNLIEFELLAAEAARRGLANDPDVQAWARPALVMRYLKQMFEPQWSAAQLPDELVAQSYQRNRNFFVHPDLVTVDHLVLTLDGKMPTDPAVQAQAVALMDEVRASLDARPPEDADAFVARATEFADQAKALGLQLRGERLGRFARQNNFDPGFVERVFQLEAPGELSTVFTSPFGWHVARLQVREPAQERTLADVDTELRARIEPEVRELKLKELTAELNQRYHVEVDPTPLGTLTADLD